MAVFFSWTKHTNKIVHTHTIGCYNLSQVPHIAHYLISLVPHALTDCLRFGRFSTVEFVDAEKSSL